MGCCKKCGGMMGMLLLVVGVLFLIRDLTGWQFWNIQWWTVAFLFLGLTKCGCSSCKDCGTCETPKKGKKK